MCAVVGFLRLILPWQHLVKGYDCCQQTVTPFYEITDTPQALCSRGGPKKCTIKLLTHTTDHCVLSVLFQKVTMAFVTSVLRPLWSHNGCGLLLVHLLSIHALQFSYSIGQFFVLFLNCRIWVRIGQ